MTNEEFIRSITDLERPLVDFYRKTLEDAFNVLEIGSGWGIFARSLMMANDKVTLVTIDKIKDLKDFEKNTAGYWDRITRIQGDSKDVMKLIEGKGNFDVVFVDGDHGYDGAFRDLNNALTIIKKSFGGGLIIVDDVLHHNNFKGDYRVMKALRDFCLQHKLDFKVSHVGNGVAIIEI